MGVYYATLNAHRNQKSREILEYLCNTGDESKLELLARAKSFPCSLHLTGWLGRVFDKLDIDSQGLVCLLRCLGSIDLPESLFYLAHKPSKTWGSDGKVVLMASQVAAVIMDETRFGLAIEQLQFVGFVTCANGKITLDLRIFNLLKIVLIHHCGKRRL